MQESKIVVVSGGFDPIHSGHIEYFEKAKELGDILVVALNSDDWLSRKKGKPFMPWIERSRIVKALKPVGYVMEFNDDDNTAINAIHKTRLKWPRAKIIFANGGDRTKENIPEMGYQDDNLEFVFGVGGSNKLNSSSWILQDWKENKTERTWGYYRVLHDEPGMKVKELTVNPQQKLSMQKHNKRSEYWIVQEGTGSVNSMTNGGYAMPPKLLSKHKQHHVERGDWHQLMNNSDVPLKIVEIQYGESCVEDDIERI
jgi:cytidyltransferase-like protein